MIEDLGMMMDEARCYLHESKKNNPLQIHLRLLQLIRQTTAGFCPLQSVAKQ